MSEGQPHSEGEQPLSEIVPKKLRPDQKLQDQPPFTWLRNEEDIFPEGFFNDPEDYPLFLRAVALKKSWAPTKGGAYGEIVTTALGTVSPEYQESAKYTAEKTREYLGKYPYAIAYLQEKWTHARNYLATGEKNPQSKFIDSTYAHFAHDKMQREASALKAKLLGIREEAPHLYEESPIEAIQNTGKGSVNQFYRIVKSGALK